MGIKPWEFRRMSPDDYHQACQGFIRKRDTDRQLDQIPFRRLYQLIYNCHSKKQVLGNEIVKMWSIPIVDGMALSMDSDHMKARWERSKKASAARKAKENERRTKGHNIN